MKENSYDNDRFFEAYSQFPRSVEGLSAAGEWHEFKRMLPDFANKKVLDIGCGFGWHCTYAAKHGAAYVLGTDISTKMLAVAQAKNQFENVEYRRVAMEELDFPKDSFEIVMSSLAFHYTPDFQAICKNVNQCLTKGGKFVFSVEHPVFTAQGKQDWIYDADQNPLYWPVDHYFNEGKREANFLGESVVKYHKTMTTYLNTLLKTGFSIDEIIEPQPDPKLLATVPDMQDELRRPMMLLVAVTKNEDFLS